LLAVLNPHHRHSLLVAALLPHLSDLGNSPPAFYNEYKSAPIYAFIRLNRSRCGMFGRVRSLV
jgi:hypothetical protein